MKMNSLIRPLLGLALVITGCGKTEIEYRHSSKTKDVESSKSNEADNHQRHEHAESNQTHFRLAVDGRTPEEPQAKETLKVKTAKSIEATPESKHIMNIQTGTINIHVGDVHHHTHVNTTTIVHEPPKKAITQEQISVPTRNSKPPASANNERCERLRREYNVRQAQWEKLFK